MLSWKGTHDQSLEPGRCVAATKHRLWGQQSDRWHGATKNTNPDPPDPFEQAKEGSVGGGERPLLLTPYLRHNFSNHPAAKPALTHTAASLSLYDNSLFMRLISKITTSCITTIFHTLQCISEVNAVDTTVRIGPTLAHNCRHDDN